MKNVLRIFIIVPFLTSLLCLLSFGEEFRMKSGEMVSGELMSYEEGTFRVKSKFGILSIEASDLVSIGVNTEEGIVNIVIGTPTQSKRDRITGTIEYVREGELKIKTEYGYVVVNPLNKATGIFLGEVALGKKGEEARPEAPAVSKEELFKDKVVSTEDFTIQIVDVIRENEELRIAFSFVNNKDKAWQFWLLEPLEESTYLVDTQGRKIPYISHLGIPTRTETKQIGRDEVFPPEKPVRLWITFGKVKEEISSFTLYTTIDIHVAQPTKVILTGIPVP